MFKNLGKKKRKKIPYGKKGKGQNDYFKKAALSPIFRRERGKNGRVSRESTEIRGKFNQSFREEEKKGEDTSRKGKRFACRQRTAQEEFHLSKTRREANREKQKKKTQDLWGENYRFFRWESKEGAGTSPMATGTYEIQKIGKECLSL